MVQPLLKSWTSTILLIEGDPKKCLCLVHSISNHPVHIIDKDENLLPSAFIPFCAFGTNISTLGVKIDKFSVPVCNSFEAKILNDQLCYEVDVKEVIDKQVLKKELDIGLTLLIDHNEDREVNIERKSELEQTYLQNLGCYDVNC